MTPRGRISSGAIAAGVVDVVLAEARVVARRDLTDAEDRRFRKQLERLRLIEERRASEQLDALASTVSGLRERIERAEREREEQRDRADRAEAALAAMHKGATDDAG